MVEHVAKKASKHNIIIHNKLLGISYSQPIISGKVRPIFECSGDDNLLGGGGTVHPEQEPPRVSVPRLFATVL